MYSRVSLTNYNIIQDNHKIVVFDSDSFNISRTHPDQAFIQNPTRPVDQVLRWHFRQAVLTNMRAAGEPVWETDFTFGSDSISTIADGPNPKQRMEHELFSRLAGYK